MERKTAFRFPPVLQDPPTPRAPRHWAIALGLAFVFGAAGIAKLMGAEPMAERFASWGYPMAFMYLVGVLEIAGAALLLMPNSGRAGSALLAVLMFGAIVTHLVAAEFLLAAAPTVMLIIIVAFSNAEGRRGVEDPTKKGITKEPKKRSAARGPVSVAEESLS